MFLLNMAKSIVEQFVIQPFTVRISSVAFLRLRLYALLDNNME